MLRCVSVEGGGKKRRLLGLGPVIAFRNTAFFSSREETLGVIRRLSFPVEFFSVVFFLLF
jgi:hypothetical protein